MALNPYTLNHLYEKGILEYVPVDLIGPTPMGAMVPMNNPYLEMAQQGGLYQNHGMYNDSFQYSGVQSPYVQNYQTFGNLSEAPIQPGTQTNAGVVNAFVGYGIGDNTPHSLSSMYGFNVGGQTNARGAIGVAEDIKNDIADGYKKSASAVNSIPKFILGLAAGAICLTGILMSFKRGARYLKTITNNSFFSKLNPKNWFSKKN